MKIKFFSSTNAILKSILDCENKTVPGSKQYDKTWWLTPGNAISTEDGKILCAKSEYPGEFIVKTLKVFELYIF